MDHEVGDKIMGIRRIFVMLSIVCFSGSIVFAQPTRGPESILKEYLEMDMNGIGLDSDGYRKLMVLTDWIDGPGWDSVTVIRGYKIGKMFRIGEKAIFPIEYDVVGIVDGGMSWEPYRKKSLSSRQKDEINVNYELIQKDGKWKIHSPQLMPHISIMVALKHHESLLPGPPDEPKIQNDMKRIVEILRKLAANK